MPRPATSKQEQAQPASGAHSTSHAHAAAHTPNSHPHPHAHANDDILRRLKSVEGHVRGVQRMIEEDAYCMDVVNQILAVQRALKKVSAMVLDRHLHTCATSAIRGGDVEERERVLDEIMELFEATGKV